MSNIIVTLRSQQGFLSMESPSVKQIQQAEESLGLQFAADFREYVAMFGIASYDGHELPGICSFPRLNVVAVTQYEREQNEGIPADWYVIEQANIDGIVIWQDASGRVYQSMPGTSPQRICESLSEYVII